MSVAELRGRTALVTGGTSGIGLATARLLTNAGAHVIVSDEDPDRGKLAATQLGSGTRFLPASIADLGDVDFLARQTPTDILIAAAAIADLHLLQGAYFLVAAVAPPMIRRGGGATVSLRVSTLRQLARKQTATRDALLCNRSAKFNVTQLAARRNSKFGVDVTEVPFDGVGADEKL